MYRQVIDTAVEKMGKTNSVYQEELRSIRRDMLTYAVDPLPTVFENFSAEK